jgi:hypothetical protein
MKINTRERLERSSSRIILGEIHNPKYKVVDYLGEERTVPARVRLLVAPSSGGYELYPLESEVDDWGYILDSERTWKHDFSELPVSGEIVWDRPEYEVVKSLDTGRKWVDSNGSTHPVIVNVFDYLTGGSPTYKVGAAAFDKVPTREEVRSRWGCSTPLNRVSL